MVEGGRLSDASAGLDRPPPRIPKFLCEAFALPALQIPQARSSPVPHPTKGPHPWPPSICAQGWMGAPPTFQSDRRHDEERNVHPGRGGSLARSSRCGVSAAGPCQARSHQRGWDRSGRGRCRSAKRRNEDTGAPLRSPGRATASTRHRHLSRKRPGSHNRAKAQQALARRYQRTANRRRDFLHKLTTSIVSAHDVICVEDLGVAGLAKTKLGRAVHDVGLGEILRQLQYKGDWNAKLMVEVDRFFPSSKLCSECGARNSDLMPRQRSWFCRCGAHHDRDINAARNILSEGLRELVAVGHTDTENARGGRVRLPMGAAATEAGITGS
jgi:IS605 OrfB family transposase